MLTIQACKKCATTSKSSDDASTFSIRQRMAASSPWSFSVVALDFRQTHEPVGLRVWPRMCHSQRLRAGFCGPQPETGSHPQPFWAGGLQPDTHQVLGQLRFAVLEELLEHLHLMLDPDQKTQHTLDTWSLTALSWWNTPFTLNDCFSPSNGLGFAFSKEQMF